ncbi:MAG: YeeE/YedE family protein [Flavobacteriales bacterium]|nr:YeeE/YedE family protein [Flavobacteriales bacterium]
MINFISQPWPWYVAGPMIGLTIPLLLILLNKPFGISSTMQTTCAIFLPRCIEYFNLNWKERGWNLIFAIGVIGGGFIAVTVFPDPNNVQISNETISKLSELGINDVSGLLPREIFSWDNLNSPVTIIMVIVGGGLVGFGTRYANGCTSGHAIMGLSLFNLASLVAVIGFFIGGLIVSWFVLPIILSVL